MRLFLDIYDAAGNRLGSGPVVTLENVSLKRVLDGCGTIKFSAPATDKYVLDNLTVRRRFRIYLEDMNASRELCRGVILKRSLSESSSMPMFNFTCSDNLEELKFVNTLIARTYSQDTIENVVNDLVSLATGWTATVEPGIASNLIDARFDGASVLKALQSICQNNGVHLRLGTGNVVEIGEFGDLSPVSIMNTAQVTPEILENDLVALIETLEAGEDAEDIVNWIIPLGSGEDAAALKLKRSTRTTPYTIQNATGPDGRTYWYLSDSASVTHYGTVQKVVTFKDIAPLSNSNADSINAANQLYDAAVVYLQRASIIQNNYKVSIRNVRATIKAGDQINVRYAGRVYRDYQVIDYAAINQDMWVLGVNENVSSSGHTVSLDISNVDKTPRDAAKVLIEAVESVELRGLKPLANVSRGGYVYQREIAPSYPAIVPVEFTDATLELLRIYVRIKTSPFRATSSGAEAGGAHRHRMFIRETAASAPVGGYRYYSCYNSTASSLLSLIFAEWVGASDLYTYDAADNHTHAIAYGISDDSETPVSLSIYVNGTNRTSALGGPFMVGGGNANFTLDVGLMTDYLVNAVGGLQQAHTIEIRCSSGRGRVEATVEFYEVIQGLSSVAAVD